MQSFFDRMAPKWDELRKTLFDDGLRDEILRKAHIRAGDRVLDAGAGTGFLAEGLLRAGAHVVALDGSAGMVAELERKFQGRVEVRLGDGHSLPFAPGEFDAVVANMYLHHTEDPPRAIREMARVLKPGGRLVLADMDTHPHEWLKAEHDDQWMGFDREAVRQWFLEAGLASANVDCAPSSCCATKGDGSAKAEVSVFVGFGTRPM